MTYRFYCNCVDWPARDVSVEGGLRDLIHERVEISRGTALHHLHRGDLRQLGAQLGYAAHPRQGLTMAGDWHVEYFRSKWHGKRVYGFVHSAIEFVFVRGETSHGRRAESVSVAGG